MNRRDFIIGAASSPLATLIKAGTDPRSAMQIQFGMPRADRLPNRTAKELAELWARTLPGLLEDMREMMDEKPGVADLIKAIQ